MSIFRSYDIRGIVPQEISQKTAYLLGQNFVEKTKAKKIVVAYDARLSSPSLFTSLAKGITSQGADVFKIGMAPTELIYFSVFKYEFSGGIMITASHNPKEYNGFKMMEKKQGKVNFIRGKEMKELKELEKKKEGKIINFDPFKDYITYLNSFIDFENKKEVVVDAGNGTAGLILKRLDIKNIIPLNYEPDGNFPNGGPNPLEKKIENKLTFLFDGDSDRIFLGKKKIINPDICFLMLIENFFKKEKGPVVFNVNSSKFIAESIKKWGGIPIRSKVGFVNIRENMIKHQAILGGELSGHYSFKNNGFFDSGFIAFLIILKSINEKPLPSLPYFKTKEINFKIKDKKTLFEKIKTTYSKQDQDFLDGITIKDKDWWFCLRTSQTEPLVRLTIEANSKKILKEKKKELFKIIQDPSFS